LKAKSGKENVFHIDETPRPDNNYDLEKYVKSDKECTDTITCIAASNDSFIVGRMNCVATKFSLPYIQQESVMKLRCRPHGLKLNCDGTKYSVLDINGVVSFYDAQDTTESTNGTHLTTERKEVWSVTWSTDNPNLCALMEKNRLFILNNFEAEEPILSAGYLCDFTDLEVKSVLLDEILKDPEEIKNIDEMFVSYE
jgi:WD repeat-containing protein 35